MAGEIWTTTLDEENLVENGEFVARSCSSDAVFSPRRCRCTLLSRCHKQAGIFNRARSRTASTWALRLLWGCFLLFVCRCAFYTK